MFDSWGGIPVKWDGSVLRSTGLVIHEVNSCNQRNMLGRSGHDSPFPYQRCLHPANGGLSCGKALRGLQKGPKGPLPDNCTNNSSFSAGSLLQLARHTHVYVFSTHGNAATEIGSRPPFNSLTRAHAFSPQRRLVQRLPCGPIPLKTSSWRVIHLWALVPNR